MTPSKSPQRILCLRFPDWPIQRRIASQPEWARSLLLLTESNSRGEFVCYRNELARQRGILAGMPVSEARTLARSRDNLVIESVQAEADRLALIELALKCESYSFCIGLEETDSPESVFMDVTGVAHFFDGEQSLAEHLERFLSGLGYAGRIAIADTMGAAWGAAHYLAGARQPVVLPCERQSQLESLPIEGLRLPNAVIFRLRRLGIQTIRQLLRLDRGALVTRFGKDVLVRLDQFRGIRDEAIIPCRPVLRYHVQRHLEDGINHPELIEQLCSKLLQQLLEQLHPRRLGTRRLECRFHLEEQASQTLTLRLCEATGDLQQIGDLLRLKLEQLHWNASLVGLEMEALEITPLASSQYEFFSGEGRDHARQFSTLLNRLSSRLGEQMVTSPCLVSDPVPERSVQFIPVMEKLPSASIPSSDRYQPLDRPAILFPEPRPVDVIAKFPDGPPVALILKGTCFDIACHWGPERIESGWWQQGNIRRDYYWIETTTGERLWLFRQLQDQRWFWHGGVS